LFGLSQIFAFKELDDSSASKSLNNGNKEESIMSSNWQTVLICLSIVTLSGGFIFGSLTFLIPRLFEVNMLQISNDVAITGLLAGFVYAVASFSQIGTGWLVDKIPPKFVLSAMGLGQLILFILRVFHLITIYYL
jgi:uncharacterized membrane protein